jgi:alanine racemase
MMLSPSKVRIDLSAIVYNLKQVRKLLGQKTKVMGIVKSDAYGHGLKPVSKTLEKNGVDRLGVAYLHEALHLRENGVRVPIVLLCGIQNREEAREVVDKNLTPVLSDLEKIEILAQEGARRGKKINFHLKVDTGMGRLGIPYVEAGHYMKKIVEHRELYLEGIISHLSSADEPQREFTETQIKHFKEAIQIGRAIGLDLPLNNMANSAGIMAYKESHFQMVRPGIMLYGGLPSPGFASPLALRPAMSAKAQVIQIRDFPEQTPISYGRTYHTEGPKRIGVISSGYGDGIPRTLSNKGKVLIGRQKVNIVGRVCMNMIMADITGLNHIRCGDEAVFLGLQGKDSITGDEMAEWIGTISYEIFCSIGQSMIREYV